MRTKDEMIAMILNKALENDQIRAVVMNGSRANPKVKPDLFQDYDIVYFVNNLDYFLHYLDWLTWFGPELIIQRPEQLDLDRGKIQKIEGVYGALMLFEDGNRIDLRWFEVNQLQQQVQQERMGKVLLDKDNLLTDVVFRQDQDYWVTKPTGAEFYACTNEFWWCCQNVAKGLWRNEIPYAYSMKEQIIRPQLDKMVSWYIGSLHHYTCSTGKLGKYFQEYLSEKQWQHYRQTYSDGDTCHIWTALWQMVTCFEQLAIETAQSLKIEYARQEGEKMKRYLKTVQNLPATATTMTIETDLLS